MVTWISGRSSIKIKSLAWKAMMRTIFNSQTHAAELTLVIFILFFLVGTGVHRQQNNDAFRQLQLLPNLT